MSNKLKFNIYVVTLLPYMLFVVFVTIPLLFIADIGDATIRLFKRNKKVNG